MKPEMSTAVMIERLRALVPDSQDGALLNQVANRIELLLEAESGMSREMACIRHALDIPPDQSVQSGVVDAFVRLNGEILELRNRLEAYDRAAKEPVSASFLIQIRGNDTRLSTTVTRRGLSKLDIRCAKCSPVCSAG